MSAEEQALDDPEPVRVLPRKWKPTTPEDLTTYLAAAEHISLEQYDPTLTEDDVPGAKLLLDSLDTYKNDALKRWLECRGAAKSGNRKELMERIQLFITSNTSHIIDASVDSYKWYNIKRKRILEENPALQHPVLPSDGWDQFPSVDIPDLFNWGHAHVYLVETAPNWSAVDLSPEEQEEYESLSQEVVDGVGRTDLARKGIRFLHSDHILQIMDCRGGDFYFVKARIQASMKSDVYFSTAAIRIASGSVRNCTCTCFLRMLGRCSHVASLLMFVTRHAEVNGYGAMSCTDRPCAWGQGTLLRDPGSIKDKAYGSETHVQRAYFDPRPTRVQKKTEKELLAVRHAFLYNVQRLYLTEYEDEEREILFDLHLEFYYEPYDESHETIRVIVKLCKMFLEEFTKTERCGPFQVPGTMGQHTSEKWKALRSFLFTASISKQLMFMTPQAFKNFLRKHLWGINPFKGNAATNYGMRSEQKARENYATEIKAKDNTASVRTTGLWRNPKCMELGCSPDGIVTSRVRPTKLLEIKCPALIKHCSPDEFEKHLTKKQQARFCLRRNEKGSLCLKEGHTYWYQIQTTMGILKLKKCDFVVWSAKGMFIQSISFQEEVWLKIIQKLVPLHHTMLIPDYFFMRTPRNLDPCLLKY